MPDIAPTITKGNKPFIRVRLPVPSFPPVIAKIRWFDYSSQNIFQSQATLISTPECCLIICYKLCLCQAKKVVSCLAVPV